MFDQLYSVELTRIFLFYLFFAHLPLGLSINKGQLAVYMYTKPSLGRLVATKSCFEFLTDCLRASLFI